MSTRRPRVTVTETDAIARRLELAAEHFPDRAGSRARLLVALTEVAERALVETEERSPAELEEPPPREAGNGTGTSDGRRRFARSRPVDSEAAADLVAAREAAWRRHLAS